MLAHELRNPLAPLANTLDILRGLENNPPNLHQALERMTRQVATLKRLVADILDISRINSQRIELQRTIVDLRSIVAHAVETEQDEITKGQLELSTRLPAEPVWVDGDAIRLEQIIANLLDNAAKYTDPGGRINLTLEVAGHKNGRITEQAVLYVNESGIGIQRRSSIGFLACSPVEITRRTPPRGPWRWIIFG
jgi:signal transduction histidine kinase